MNGQKFGINMALSVRVFDNAEEAAAAGFDYNKWPTQPTALEVDSVVVVRNGTMQGNATIDLVLVDEKGNKYVTMITRNLLSMVLATAGGPLPSLASAH